MRLYPVNFVLSDKPCAVIGGGEVAARKVSGLIEAGADVTVIAPQVCNEIEKRAQRDEVKIILRKYRKGDLKGMTIALAATDEAALNSRIAKDARASKVPVNVADAPDECDFTLPAVLRRGDVSVAVGTGGSSPALARKMKEIIEKVIGPEYGEVARILGELRARFTARGEKLYKRRALFESLIDSDLTKRLKRRDWAGARKIVKIVSGEDVQ